MRESGGRGCEEGPGDTAAAAAARGEEDERGIVKMNVSSNVF